MVVTHGGSRRPARVGDATPLHRCGVILVAVLLAVGCDAQVDTPAGAAGLNRRDSAGVEIVEVGGDYLDRLPTWRIGGDPSVVVGQVEGEEPYLFTAIDESSVAVLEDGTLAIADGGVGSGSAEIRLFDSSGTFLRRFGGVGEGPGSSW